MRIRCHARYGTDLEENQKLRKGACCDDFDTIAGNICSRQSGIRGSLFDGKYSALSGVCVWRIALATAPAPVLSIVKEFHAKGPATDTLLPMTVLDDIVGIVVFFTVNSLVAREVSGGTVPLIMIPVMIFCRSQSERSSDSRQDLCLGNGIKRW